MKKDHTSPAAFPQAEIGREMKGADCVVEFQHGAQQRVLMRTERDAASRGVDRDFVHRHLAESVEEMIPVLDTVDAKTALQELCAQQGHHAPHYETLGEGPDHDRVFTANVVIGNRTLGTGRGRTKKAAEQVAAREAIARLTH